VVHAQYQYMCIFGYLRCVGMSMRDRMRPLLLSACVCYALTYSYACAHDLSVYWTHPRTHLLRSVPVTACRGLFGFVFSIHALSHTYMCTCIHMHTHGHTGLLPASASYSRGLGDTAVGHIALRLTVRPLQGIRRDPKTGARIEVGQQINWIYLQDL
jgi:hypothetical protein